MTGKPGKDARSALKQSAVIIPVVVVILAGTLLFWLFRFKLP